jgi:hypothetical protein
MLRLLFKLGIVLFSGLAMAIEEPNYSILETSGEIELRAYDSMIVAETVVSGSMDKASSAGFRLIAGYIFGDNTARTGGSEKISMTAPVTMESEPEPEPKSEKISMTAPVTMTQSPDQTSGTWRVHFVMPSEHTLDTLPRPNNPAVTLREIPGQQVAVVRFSGRAGEEKTAAKTAELLAWLETKQITPTGKPELARYNPPWTLPFLRRNEVLVAY